MFSRKQSSSNGSPELSTPETVVGKGSEIRSFARRSKPIPIPAGYLRLTIRLTIQTPTAEFGRRFT
jgi:hypothetical protein